MGQHGGVSAPRRSTSAAGVALLVLAALAGVVACTSGGPVAHDEGPGKPTAVVAMGDSFISGEGGRWLGNSRSGSPGHDGTDRAFVDGSADPSAVYGQTVVNGCHRSDVADIASSGIEVDARINLACSGASTRNLWRAQSGGEPHKGEPPQADQLAEVARTHHVEMVVVSVGGNDLGYSDIATSCGMGFVTNPIKRDSNCLRGAADRLEDSLPGAMAGVAKVVDEIRSTMSAAGQQPDTYRIVLRSYPSPLPPSAENRHPANAFLRLQQGGCPFGDAASDWARDVFVPRVAQELAALAAAEQVELLDLSEAFAGHELCARAAEQVGGDGPDGATAEWVRWVDLLFRQGSRQESMHPNAFGQMALGRCIGLVYGAAPASRHECVATPGKGPEAMRLS